MSVATKRWHTRLGYISLELVPYLTGLELARHDHYILAALCISVYGVLCVHEGQALEREFPSNKNLKG